MISSPTHLFGESCVAPVRIHDLIQVNEQEEGKDHDRDQHRVDQLLNLAIALFHVLVAVLLQAAIFFENFALDFPRSILFNFVEGQPPTHHCWGHAHCKVDEHENASTQLRIFGEHCEKGGSDHQLDRKDQNVESFGVQLAQQTQTAHDSNDENTGANFDATATILNFKLSLIHSDYCFISLSMFLNFYWYSQIVFALFFRYIYSIESLRNFSNYFFFNKQGFLA